jgi:hypothetical protein
MSEIGPGATWCAQSRLPLDRGGAERGGARGPSRKSGQAGWAGIRLASADGADRSGRGVETGWVRRPIKMSANRLQGFQCCFSLRSNQSVGKPPFFQTLVTRVLVSPAWDAIQRTLDGIIISPPLDLRGGDGQMLSDGVGSWVAGGWGAVSPGSIFCENNKPCISVAYKENNHV